MTRLKPKVKRSRGYGMVKIKKGQKLSWLSMENRHGWSLGLALNNRTIWLKHVRFSSQEEIERAIEHTNIVFVDKKGN